MTEKHQDPAWIANLATGNARCLLRFIKGEEWARAHDLLYGVEYRGIPSPAQAKIHARNLLDQATALAAHLEGKHP